MSNGSAGDENSPVSVSDMGGNYKRSKWLAEQIALEKARAGQPVVIVNPTAPVGDHDWKPTPTGNIILSFLRNKLPAFVDTGLNLVDVRDIAEGHLLAAEKGIPGERYILGCQNLTLAADPASAGRAFRQTRTHHPDSIWRWLTLQALVNTAWANLTGKEPGAPLEGVKMARTKMFVTHAKASMDLGFSPGPVDDALGRAIGWFRANGYC